MASRLQSTDRPALDLHFADIPRRLGRFNGSGWVYRVVRILISITVLILALAAMRSIDLSAMVAVLPENPLFWLVFMLCYFAVPAADWLIFRRLWNLPSRGIVPLTRKHLGNELLLGYSGEVYFYTWAREHAEITTAPFGAIKDVSILSALTGNIATLLLLCAALPFAGLVGIGQLASRTTALSAAVIFAVSALSMRFGNRLFTLPGRELRFVAMVHTVRISSTTLLTGLLWHLCVPALSLKLLLVLASVRLLVGRLPFVPNTEVVFAGSAAALLGPDTQVIDMVAMLAAATLVTHLVVAILFVVPGLVREARR